MHSYFGMMPPPTFGPSEAAAAKPPTFTAQPQVQSLYQIGGALRITGAAVTGYTSLQWQRFANGAWSDYVGQKSAIFNVASALSDVTGKFRLKAVNGNSTPAYSNEVDVVNAYLSFGVDSGGGTVTKTSNTQYAWNTAPGGKYISWYYFRASDNQQFSPVGLAGRALVTWTTSNANVISVTGTNPAAPGQAVSTAKAGTATVTGAVGTLKSTLNVTVQ